MNCERIEELFSSHFDGQLAADERTTFDTHLAGCVRCAAGWSEYRAAVEALRRCGTATTSPELQAATLAAVAQAALAGERRWRPLPLVLATLAGAAAALWFAWLLLGFGRGADPGGAVERSLEVVVADARVVLPPGATRSVGGVVLSRSAAGLLSVRAESTAPTIVERIVERIVEKVVEVPVERVVEVPVERVVEVPVPRGPAFTIDLGPLAAALRNFSADLTSGLLAVAAAQRAANPPTVAPHAAVVAAAPVPPSLPRGASLQVWRQDGHLTLEAAGTLTELVPALLCQLSTADAELQGLIQRQLAAIHEQAAADPAIRGALADMPRPTAEPTPAAQSLFGGRRSHPDAGHPAAAWAAWWDANGSLITQSASL
jgi:hypothetical protein